MVELSLVPKSRFVLRFDRGIAEGEKPLVVVCDSEDEVVAEIAYWGVDRLLDIRQNLDV